ncbi:hypothetical protein WH47_09062 [Habropoda laboriosa]|uniref:Uncharacterized protein n=1 Tax=Habropoda laboriosa TaxID=597456 RepID=A0A0L7QLP4_9HYME|nr:hypothetical protein WH47_09062 [Habropoda laboriosa]
MKNAHPIITATSSSSLVNPDSSSSNEPTEPIIRLKLDKPLHWEWELTTSADTLPVIQLLDKDGRLLVETTGRTAQRARGSFREGLTSHEEFPEKPSTLSSSFSSSSAPSTVIQLPLQGNRNVDGFSSKFGTCQFGYKPRKSRSEVTSNEDIAKDYFKRVYELLKKRQEKSKRIAEKQEVAGCDDSSSSNYAEKVQKKRPRRKKKERSMEGKKWIALFSRCASLFCGVEDASDCREFIHRAGNDERVAFFHSLTSLLLFIVN